MATLCPEGLSLLVMEMGRLVLPGGVTHGRAPRTKQVLTK